MLDYIFPPIKVKVVGKIHNPSFCGVSDYAVESIVDKERSIITHSTAWAEIGDEFIVRNYWFYWA